MHRFIVTPLCYVVLLRYSYYLHHFKVESSLYSVMSWSLFPFKHCMCWTAIITLVQVYCRRKYLSYAEQNVLSSVLKEYSSYFRPWKDLRKTELKTNQAFSHMSVFPVTLWTVKIWCNLKLSRPWALRYFNSMEDFWQWPTGSREGSTFCPSETLWLLLRCLDI